MTIIGQVVEGKGEGRKIGYPTANLQYSVSQKQLESGVWIVRVLVGYHVYHALAVVGMWKLENGLPSVEVHLLDFSDDIYKKTLVVSFAKFVRPLEKFTTMKALVEQIKNDVKEAEAYFTAADVRS